MSENQKVSLNQFNQSNLCMERYTSPVTTVKPDDSIYETLFQMQKNSIKHIVVAEGKKPVGIVTERDINRFLEGDKTSRGINEIPIKNVMIKNVITLLDGQEDHFQQCATRMNTFNVGSVILVDDNGELIGIVTKRDIAKAYSVIHAGKFRVKDFMSNRLLTCRNSDSIRYALETLNKNRISRLVVTDNEGFPLGLVTTNTFLSHSDYFTRGKTRSRDYLLPLDKENLTVGELVSKDLLTVNREDDLANAAALMTKKEVNGVPIVDEKRKLSGMITSTDVVRAFDKVDVHDELKDRYKTTY